MHAYERLLSRVASAMRLLRKRSDTVLTTAEIDGPDLLEEGVNPADTVDISAVLQPRPHGRLRQVARLAFQPTTSNKRPRSTSVHVQRCNTFTFFSHCAKGSSQKFGHKKSAAFITIFNHNTPAENVVYGMIILHHCYIFLNPRA